MIDLAKIIVIGGAGGNGCVSFRREKFVPRGGPTAETEVMAATSYIVGDDSINTLLHLRYNSRWRGSVESTAEVRTDAELTGAM